MAEIMLLQGSFETKIEKNSSYSAKGGIDKWLVNITN
jgi:hypothetical protein